MKLTYLASPYNDESAELREKRYQEACKACVWLMNRDWAVYSPIVHNHPLATNYEAERELRELTDNARRRGWQYLFTNSKTKTHYGSIKTAWNTACRLAGIEGLHFHDLRRTFGTRAADGGANLADLQKILGHAQIGTTMGYVEATEEGKRRAVNAVQGKPAKVLKMRRRG